MERKYNITILGSTGSIGTQTLDVIRSNSQLFGVTALTANSNWELLSRQAKEFSPKRVVIAEEKYLPNLKESLKGLDIEIEAGRESVAGAAAIPESDTVVTAMVGYSGMLPTIRAIGAGKRIALANKETLVVAGELITRLLKESESEIIPVDSEHSAIFQCLTGEKRSGLKKIILTASGGPFRTYTYDQLKKVTLDDALRHPNWQMGAKVTVDSATMMNKGFEMIEARWLFDCKPQDIDIIVHPQSVIHSMVEFCDGSVKAQLGVPDMRIPISYALGYPERICSGSESLDFSKLSALTFEKPDSQKFPLLPLAFSAIEEGGTAPCIMNAANEVAVASFLKKEISFTDIYSIVDSTMQSMNPSRDVTLENLTVTNEEAVRKAQEQLSRFR